MSNLTRDADFDFAALKEIHGECVQRAILSAHRTTLICGYYFREGLAARQIAAKVGCSEGAVRQIIRRARLEVEQHNQRRRAAALVRYKAVPI